jgi:hypothetical protein
MDRTDAIMSMRREPGSRWRRSDSQKAACPGQRRQNRHIPQTSSYLHRVTSMLSVRITSPSEEMMIRFAASDWLAAAIGERMAKNPF